MSTSPQANFGYFDAFMRAWGDTPEVVHADVYAETLEYNAGLIPAPQYVADVSAELGIPLPRA